MKILNTTTKDIIVLGVLSGMRANAGLLCTTLLIRKQPGSYFSPSRIVQFFNSKKSLMALSMSGAGEMIMDKLPTTPDRIDPGGLSARIISGAVCGAAVSKAAGKKPLPGIITGGLAALVSSFAFYYLRKKFSKAAKITDPIVGAAEDAVAFAFGVKLLKSNKPL